jgi:hypothetical protein
MMIDGRKLDLWLRGPKPDGDFIRGWQPAGVHAATHARRNRLGHPEDVVSSDKSGRGRIAAAKVVLGQRFLIDVDHLESADGLGSSLDALGERRRVGTSSKAEYLDLHSASGIWSGGLLASHKGEDETEAGKGASHGHIVTPPGPGVFQ